MQMKQPFFSFLNFATWLPRCIVVLIHGKMVNDGFIGKKKRARTEPIYNKDCGCSYKFIFL